MKKNQEGESEEEWLKSGGKIHFKSYALGH